MVHGNFVSRTVEQYFTIVLFVNTLTPRVKPWVIQSFQTLILWTEPLSVTIHWKAVEQHFTVVLFIFIFTQIVILQNLSIFDLALSGV